MANTKSKLICRECQYEFESEDYTISYANAHEFICPKCGKETYNF